MSASLVGSEMCIRDSNGPGRRAGARGVRDHLGNNDPSRDLPVLCEIAVSYTHLTLPTICSV
eukprot:2683607-Alexandrium_andersonii.AAC.1